MVNERGRVKGTQAPKVALVCMLIGTNLRKLGRSMEVVAEASVIVKLNVHSGASSNSNLVVTNNHTRIVQSIGFGYSTHLLFRHEFTEH